MTNKQILKRNYYYLNEYAKKQKSADIFLKDIFFLVDKNNNICCIRQDNVSNNNGIEDILFELLKVEIKNNKFTLSTMAICDTTILRYKKNPTAKLNLICVSDITNVSAYRKGYCSILLHTFENYLKQEKIKSYTGLFHPISSSKNPCATESAFYFYQKNNCKLINEKTKKDIKKISSLSVVDPIWVFKANKDFRKLKTEQIGDILVLSGYEKTNGLKILNNFWVK